MDLAQAIIAVAFGALAGGITNAVAVWMLFHPYSSWGWGPFRIQGAVPKNRPRLARTVGRTVGERLLTSDDLARQLNAPGVRQAFDQAVGGFVETMLRAERGSLRDQIPAAVIGELEGIFAAVAPALAERVTAYAETPEFQAAVRLWLERLTAELAERPLSEVLTAARREALRERVESWVSDLVASPDLDRAVGDWLERQIARLKSDHTPLLERLPPGLVTAVEHGITQYLPVALERLAGVLADPTARARVQRALHGLYERFAKDLLLHQRIVARLVVTEKTIARLLDSFEREGVEQLAEVLEEPDMQARVARGVNDAVVSFLRRSLGDHIAALGQERIAGLKAAAVEAIGEALRDPGTRAFAIERLDRALEAAERRTWGDLLRRLPPERAAEWLGTVLATSAARAWISDGVQAAFQGLLAQPLGRPADWLPAGSVDRITKLLSATLWEWTQRYVPEIVGRLDVAGAVEQKVLNFSLHRLEEIIRSATQRELDLIVRLGYVLGAVVGVAAYVAGLVAR